MVAANLLSLLADELVVEKQDLNDKLDFEDPAAVMLVHAGCSTL